MTLTGVFTTAAAVYGALVSTFTLVLHQREKKQKVRVKLVQGCVGVKFVTDIVQRERLKVR
jgi:hypothetical protein